MESKWNKILLNNKSFLISSHFTESSQSWTVFMTDLIELKMENLSKETIVNRCQKLNPLLCIEDINLDQVIGELMRNIENHIVDAKDNEINLKMKMEGGVFKFAVNLTEASRQEFFDKITRNLCSIISQLQGQNEILLKEIEKKDEEITEYKLNGAKLIRQRIETKPFSKDLLEVKRIKLDDDTLFSMFCSMT